MNTALVWFRQDLRLEDNPAFAKACNEYESVIALYVLDEANAPLGGAQKWWLHHSLQALGAALQKRGLVLVLKRGKPLDLILALVEKLAVKAVYWNRCYEPLAIKRDTEIKAVLSHRGVDVTSFNGSLLLEPWLLKNQQGDYFKVFTPFWKRCMQTLSLPSIARIQSSPTSPPCDSETLLDWQLLPQKPNWAAGFSAHWQPGEKGAQQQLTFFIHTNLQGYHTARDKPALKATSHLSPHLHFGEISPFEIWRAIELAKLEKSCDLVSAERFLTEMGWREFSYYLLYHFPKLPEANFKQTFDDFPWEHNSMYLQRWQKGLTGFPIIDAGMRELWQTGYMHNRVRMLVASFLTKDLLIDWRLGAAWFMDTLVDADLANNSASWQWVAGSGADAAPYFRIFNPSLQGEKFDPQGEYIKRWVPELANLKIDYIHRPWLANTEVMKNLNYPPPLINHDEARKRALVRYKMLKTYQM